MASVCACVPCRTLGAGCVEREAEVWEAVGSCGRWDGVSVAACESNERA